MNLWDEVREAAARTRDVTVLAPTAAQSFIDRAADKFVRDRTYRWRWATLHDPGVKVPYAEAVDGIAELASRLRGVKQISLMVTNEEPEPAGS